MDTLRRRYVRYLKLERNNDTSETEQRSHSLLNLFSRSSAASLGKKIVALKLAGRSVILPCTLE